MIITVDDLVFDFPLKRALTDVSFQISPGTITAVDHDDPGALFQAFRAAKAASSALLAASAAAAFAAATSRSMPWSRFASSASCCHVRPQITNTITRAKKTPRSRRSRLALIGAASFP
jgi:hypothetical protein